MKARISRNFPVGKESRLDRLRGHALTLGPYFARTFRPPARPPTQAFLVELTDPQVGRVALTGRLLDVGGPDLVVALHGLGGSTASAYMGLVLAAAQAAGRSCLLLNVRGADRSGTDISHSGLTDDIVAALGAPELSKFRAIDLFGYSLGGHLALKYACGPVDPRLRRVAAIGSPLLLDRSAAAFDVPAARIYRHHVMLALHEIYTAAYQRNPSGIVPLEARRIRHIREWDERVVAPRFGFASREAYYAAASAGPVLNALAVPALYVGAPLDPMVPPAAVLPALPADRLEVVWDRGAGHLGFAPDFDLGQPGPPGLEAQVLSWLAHGPRPHRD